MDLEQITRSVLDSLPGIFTADDVVARAGLSTSSTFKVNAILKRLAGQGVVYRSLVLKAEGSGRPPFGWSTDPRLTAENVVRLSVEEVLPSMPRLWTVRDLATRLQVGSRLRPRLVEALDQLVEAGKVIRTTERVLGPGRPKMYWSADPRTIEMELRIRELRRKDTDDRHSRLERLLKPFDPKV